MKINIYYGGRGLLDDPTLYVLDKMQEVFEELRVEVTRYNLMELKNEINTLPQTLKEADGIILATTVEWLGMGGYMQLFLDACWLYGDKEKISTLYMQPVVMSTTYGERECRLMLSNAWEILGGLPSAGICGYVDDLVQFEMNKEYTEIIEKKAENLYRVISQKQKRLPTSNQAVKKTVLRKQSIKLTPQESEQLSQYVSNDDYVKTQKEDIEELAHIFKDLMGKDTPIGPDVEYIEIFENKFVPQEEFNAKYMILIEGKKKPLVVEVSNDNVVCHYGHDQEVDVIVKLVPEVLENIIYGRSSFQRAFMTGEMTAKGNFKTLRMLDKIFSFSNS